jgi:hypothetical protein
MWRIIDFNLATQFENYYIIAATVDGNFAQLRAAKQYEILERPMVECSSKLHCQLKCLSSLGHFRLNHR